jgi:parallel beta-helix repeat protein
MGCYGTTGPAYGKPVGSSDMCAGIYFDYYNSGQTITNNVVYKSNWIGLFFSGCQDMTITGNTVYDCDFGVRIAEFNGLGEAIRTVNFDHNIVFAKGDKVVLELVSQADDFDQFGMFDYNYYAKPTDNSLPIYAMIDWGTGNYSLTQWQSLYNQDAHSHISPIAITDTSLIDFYYNPTQSDSTITLATRMIDVTGASYNSSITLSPYTGAVLMPNSLGKLMRSSTGRLKRNSTGNLMRSSIGN